MSFLTGSIRQGEEKPKQIPALFKPKETQMEDKEKAAKIAKMRKRAEDKTLPQDVRNQMLDNANKMEQEMGEKASGMKYAKGGYAKKKMAMGGEVATQAMSAPPMMGKGKEAMKAAVAPMVQKMKERGMARRAKAAAPTTMMAKGGYANCGASMKPQQKGKK